MAAGDAYAALLQRLESARHLGVDFGLDRMRAALARLGNPHLTLRAVQIAGTNGKGSTAAMTESILRAAGFRTGLFTSPHLSRFTERIRINGREADGDHLAALDARIAATGVPLTYFEIATALGFLAMAEAGVEAAVLETGLGGRLDAVTVCAPVATAITSIGFDHMDLLGNTLPEIAREKAGIAKASVPIYLGPLPTDARDEVVRVARLAGAPVLDVGAHAAPALAGVHQKANAGLAVHLARALSEAAGRALDEGVIAEGLRDVRWPGRLEMIAPDVLLDGAHNTQGAAALVAALPERRPRALVISLVRGKDAQGVLSHLTPAFDVFVATQSSNVRSLLAADLVQQLPQPASQAFEDPLAALNEARRLVAPQGLVVVAGSLFLVGQVRARLLGEQVDPLPGGDPLP